MEWPDLTDPRTNQIGLHVHSTAKRWRHICEDHVTIEPWELLLPIGSIELEKVRRINWSKIHDFASHPDLKPLIDAIEALLRRALLRPLVMTYQFVVDGYTEPRWIVVLPNGLKLVLRIDPQDQSCHLVTCFLQQSVIRWLNREDTVSAADIWKRTVSRTVSSHCKWDEKGLLPADTKSLPNRRGQRAEDRTGITYLTPAEWGFAREQQPIKWLGQLKPWPDAEPAKEIKQSKRRSPFSAPEAYRHKGRGEQ